MLRSSGADFKLILSIFLAIFNHTEIAVKEDKGMLQGDFLLLH